MENRRRNATPLLTSFSMNVMVVLLMASVQINGVEGLEMWKSCHGKVIQTQ